jgi:probable rRNA maturation factor
VIFIEIDEKYRDQIPSEILEEAARLVLKIDFPEDSPSLTVKITGDQEILELNTTYRGIQKATDVLSFEADYFDPDLGSHYLGDVVISYPQAANQAETGGHPVEAELQLLTIHGLLHLMGYDHSSAKEKELMWSKQKQALDELGLKLNLETEDSI